MHGRQALRSPRTARSATLVAVALAAAAAFLSLVPAASAAKPVEVSQPTIEGTLRQDRTVSAGVGIWANTPLSYTYQWHRCNAAGAACAPLSGLCRRAIQMPPAGSGGSRHVRRRGTVGS